MADAAEQLRRFLGKEKSHIDDVTTPEPVEELNDESPVPSTEVAPSDDED